MVIANGFQDIPITIQSDNHILVTSNAIKDMLCVGNVNL